MAASYEGGSGPDLVLLHGLGSRWQVFSPIIAGLEQHYRVLALDFPGFGARPEDPTLRAGVQGLADWVTAELSARGIAEPHIVGSSMGAGVALELAHRRVAGRVTAFAPIGFWNRLELNWTVGVLTVLRAAARTLARPLGYALRVRAGRGVLLGLLFGRPTRVAPEAAIEDLAALADSTGFVAARNAFHTHHPAPPSDEVPTTIVWGRRDAILPAGPQARRARAAWSSARHVLLAGCGHLPFSDAHERCLAIITDTFSPTTHRMEAQ